MELTKMRFKKKYLLFFMLLSSLLAGAQTSVWDGRREIWRNGSGTADDPYRIETADNLAFLAYMVNKGYDTDGLYFSLSADLDLCGEAHPWKPIGLGDRWANEDGCDRGVLESGSAFKGHFDGDGHGISNLYVEDGYSNSGLFGYVVGDSANPATIKNVSVVSGTLHGKNCGGIVGHAHFVQLSRCWNGATVEGNNVGGILGRADHSTINNCYHRGEVSGIGDHSCTGGLVGLALDSVRLSNSYHVGDIAGSNHVGCLLGEDKDATTVVENCHYLNTCLYDGDGIAQDEDFMRSMDFVHLLNEANEELVWAFDKDNVNHGFPVFEEGVFLIVVIPDPPTGGVVHGESPYSVGSDCTVVAEAGPHHVFVNWTESGEVVSEDSVYCFVVTSDRTLVAHFNFNQVNDNRVLPVRLFPNPAHDRFFIEGDDVRKVTVLSVLGQVLDEFEVEREEQSQISLKGYASGVFLIRVSLKEGDVLLRLVKM